MKKWLALILVCLLLTGCGSTPAQTTPTTQETQPVYNTMTAQEVMQEMTIGWNLGNTLDAPDGETSWGNPPTTKEMIQKLYDLGFRTLRIPISWHRHVSDAPEYTIDEIFMSRVDMVVNYGLELGMYVIINSHHDNDVYMPTPENQARGEEYLSAIWKQIAEHFEYADHHLIFQTMNEPRVVGTSYEWNIDTKNEDCMASIEVVSALNQAALDAIRQSGGRNADRFVIISPYAANTMAAMVDKFQMPVDSAENKLILSIHAYTPYNLCLNTQSDEASFGIHHLTEIKGFMKNVNYRYVQKGIPVIIDEMGCLDKKNPEARYAWAKAYVAAAKEYGMVCCWWDNNLIDSSGENFGLLDRRKLEVFPDSQSVYEGLMAGLE